MSLSDPRHPRDPRFSLSVASEQDRALIYAARHAVYAEEIRQHPANDAGQLRDPLDEGNVYLVVKVAGALAGFISITPPGQPAYSIEKYFARDALPFPFDAGLYEVRLLTVLKPHRGRELAVLLMFAAFRWVEAHGGERVMAIGRREILDLYLKSGLEPVGLRVESGAVTFEVLHARMDAFRAVQQTLSPLLARIERHTLWQLPFPFRKPAPCFHGGRSITAVGTGFELLEFHAGIINADVLDAWFPPAPGVIAALTQHLPWMLRTSPPAACEGFIEAVAGSRGVTPASILPGAGSSDLIFRALRHWLTSRSRALVLDPTYGEYAHVLEKVIGCRVDRLPLHRADDYRVNRARLHAAVTGGEYDLIALVNPNSPTGQHIARAELEMLLRRVPPRTRVWIDETYVEYAGREESLERFAAQSEQVIICKSMSKVYALSGVRAAYLCAGAHQLEALRAITPPWALSFPAQVAAARALQDPDYYEERYSETHALRTTLAEALEALGCHVVRGVANFLLCDLPADGASTSDVVRACESRGLFLRDAAAMGAQLGDRAIRVAVKDAATNRRMVEILRDVLGSFPIVAAPARG